MVGINYFLGSIMSMLVVSSALAEPIHGAAKEGNSAQVNRLIEKGYDVNTKDENGLTPLHFAVANGHLEVAHLLLGYRATYNLQDGNTGSTLQNMNIEGRWKGIEKQFCFPGRYGSDCSKPTSDVMVEIVFKQSERQVEVTYIESGERVHGNCTIEGKGLMCKLQKTQRSEPSFGGRAYIMKMIGHEVCIINSEESISCAGNVFVNGEFAGFSIIRQLSR